MIRSKSDRRVRVVMATIARALASPHASSSGLVTSVASMILSDGNQADRFDLPNWRADAMPPIVLAHVVGCPSSVLDQYVARARDQLAWIEWWDREGWIEAQGWTPLLERAA